jgi:hypothetical protein
MRETAPIANMSRSLPIALAAWAYRAEGQCLNNNSIRSLFIYVLSSTANGQLQSQHEYKQQQ